MHGDGFAIASGPPLGRACMPPIITPPRCSSSPPAWGGEQSLPPRSAAIKSARARGLADLIDNLGAALPAAAVFLSTARAAAKYPSAGDPHSRGGATFWVAPPETRLARIGGPARASRRTSAWDASLATSRAPAPSRFGPALLSRGARIRGCEAAARRRKRRLHESALNAASRKRGGPDENSGYLS